MNYYNQRDKKGRFIKRIAVPRAKDGKFTSKLKIVPGRLYNYKNAVVRVKAVFPFYNEADVSFHKTLFGTVRLNELTKIDKSKVNNYLAAA